MINLLDKLLSEFAELVDHAIDSLIDIKLDVICLLKFRINGFEGIPNSTFRTGLMLPRTLATFCTTWEDIIGGAFFFNAKLQGFIVLTAFNDGFIVQRLDWELSRVKVGLWILCFHFVLDNVQEILYDKIRYLLCAVKFKYY